LCQGYQASHAKRLRIPQKGKFWVGAKFAFLHKETIPFQTQKNRKLILLGKQKQISQFLKKEHITL
jgi:hypothetical protein